jgi:hypothetical protein
MHQPTPGRLAPKEHEMQAIQEIPRSTRSRVAVLVVALGIAAAVTAGGVSAATAPVYPANLVRAASSAPKRVQPTCQSRTQQAMKVVTAAENRDGSLHGRTWSTTGGTTSVVSCLVTRQKIAQHVHGAYPNEATMVPNPVLSIH